MPSFESHGVRGGVWFGRLTASDAPARLCLTWQGEVVATGALTPHPQGGWDVRVALPAQVIADGVTSLILVADDGPEDASVGPGSVWLGQLNLATGSALDGDAAAQVALLRSELELLKREFRRHAADRPD